MNLIEAAERAVDAADVDIEAVRSLELHRELRGIDAHELDRAIEEATFAALRNSLNLQPFLAEKLNREAGRQGVFEDFSSPPPRLPASL
ncbi:hypothetical protein BE11_03350 [Sorangium cellulosum]|nr:hypothetical protein BE11_03350 [Sorangium cellulosum]